MIIMLQAHEHSPRELTLSMNIRTWGRGQHDLDVHRHGTVQLFPGEDDVYTALTLVARAIDEYLQEMTRA